MPVYHFGSKTPKIDSSVFIAPNASIIGDVEIGPEASILFGCTIRGDVHYIRIGEGTNIQDNSVIHVTTDTNPTIIEANVTIAHQVLLHGCTVKSGVMIGMGSVIMDRAVIGEDSIVGAGSLVTEGTVIPDGMLAFGRPARIKRKLRPEEIFRVATITERYRKLGRRYRDPEWFGKM